MSVIDKMQFKDTITGDPIIVDIGCDADNISDLTLNKVSDVNITTPSEGQVLKYNGTSGKWENNAASNAVTSVNGETGAVVLDASNVGAIASTTKGIANGVAELDANGKVPSAQLPSFVDDVIEGYYNTIDGKFYEESTYTTEITPESGKIYVDLSTDKTYRWGGSAYAEISESLALGETSSTAYRGDRGKTAYDHATDASKLSTAQASGLYKIATTAEGHVASVTAVQKSDITALGIPESDTNTLTGLTDTTIAVTPTDGDVLKYDGTSGKWINGEGGGTIDTELSPTSENPVQNKVITNVIPDKGFGNTWSEKTWSGLTSFDGKYVWTDSGNIYYSNGSDQYIFNKNINSWEEKTWSGLTSFDGQCIWTDGENIYSEVTNNDNYVLNKNTSTWELKNWSIDDGADILISSGEDIWSDGENIYWSGGSMFYLQLILDKTALIWHYKTWNGLTGFLGRYVWTDGDNIYYSNGSSQYILDKATSTWNAKTWNGLMNFDGRYIWTDGDNVYYSNGSNQYVLDKSTSTWSTKTWNELTNFDGRNIWIDGDNIYYSDSSNQYSLFKQKGFGTSATKDYTTSVTEGSSNLVTSGAVYDAIDTAIGQVLNTPF